MLLPCGFLPANLDVQSDNVADIVPSQVSGTADEEQEVQESSYSSVVEAGEDREVSTVREEEDWEADYISV